MADVDTVHVEVPSRSLCSMNACEYISVLQILVGGFRRTGLLGKYTGRCFMVLRSSETHSYVSLIASWFVGWDSVVGITIYCGAGRFRD